jgi:hypothetical protein
MEYSVRTPEHYVCRIKKINLAAKRKIIKFIEVLLTLFPSVVLFGVFLISKILWNRNGYYYPFLLLCGEIIRL